MDDIATTQTRCSTGILLNPPKSKSPRTSAQMSSNACDPVGMLEIAERLGVRTNTVSQWRYRSLRGQLTPPLPEPRWVVSGYEAWSWSEVKDWAIATRRLTLFRSKGSDYEQ